MRSMGIVRQIRVKWVQTTQSAHRYPVADNLLNRNFTPQQLYSVWVSDINCIPSKGEWETAGITPLLKAFSKH